MASDLRNSGLEVSDLYRNPEFLARNHSTPDFSARIEGLLRLSQAFLETPDSILQELVNSALYLCNADSAGISIEQSGKPEEEYFLWTAVSGQFARFRNSTLPRYPSACDICLTQGRVQTLRINCRFYDLMSIEAPPVTDGVLLPWTDGEQRGTLWLMAHGREEAFDREDVRTAEVLARFAGMASAQARKRRAAADLVHAAATAETAAGVSCAIERFLLSDPTSFASAGMLAEHLRDHLQRLNSSLKTDAPGNR